MKIPHCPSKHARGCLLLLILMNLGVSSAFGGFSLGGTIRAIKNRVENTIHKIRKVGDGETSSPRYREDERRIREDDLDQRNLTKRELQRRPAPSQSKPPMNPSDDKPNIRERNPSTKPSKKPTTNASKANAAAESAKKTAASKAPSEVTTEEEVIPPTTIPPLKLSYARPVPMHPGFVYAPGDSAELKNMLDVRGCAPGRTMLDPRSGKKFLVP